MKHIECDKHGHLNDPKSWDKNTAVQIAKQENISLNSHHWLIFNIIRNFYFNYSNFPSNRVLIQLLKNNYPEQFSDIDSIKLQKLFPDSPIRQATKIAGLPKPHRCI